MTEKPPYRGTRLRSFRIADELYDRAAEQARKNGETLSEVIRQALEEYADRDDER